MSYTTELCNRGKMILQKYTVLKYACNLGITNYDAAYTYIELNSFIFNVNIIPKHDTSQNVGIIKRLKLM